MRHWSPLSIGPKQSVGLPRNYCPLTEVFLNSGMHFHFPLLEMLISKPDGAYILSYKQNCARETRIPD